MNLLTNRKWLLVVVLLVFFLVAWICYQEVGWRLFYINSTPSSFQIKDLDMSKLVEVDTFEILKKKRVKSIVFCGNEGGYTPVWKPGKIVNDPKAIYRIVNALLHARREQLRCCGFFCAMFLIFENNEGVIIRYAIHFKRDKNSTKDSPEPEPMLHGENWRSEDLFKIYEELFGKFPVHPQPPKQYWIPQGNS
jgi:hypothetical protein